MTQTGAAQVGVPSRKGALRTIAAVHHQKNQAVATPRIRHIECRNGVACDDREINCLLILGVRDVPNLEATPSHARAASQSNIWLRGLPRTLPLDQYLSAAVDKGAFLCAPTRPTFPLKQFQLESALCLWNPKKLAFPFAESPRRSLALFLAPIALH
jgi:hypothetical protein